MSLANRSQSPIFKLNKRKAPELILTDTKVKQKIKFLFYFFYRFIESGYIQVLFVHLQM